MENTTTQQHNENNKLKKKYITFKVLFLITLITLILTIIINIGYNVAQQKKTLLTYVSMNKKTETICFNINIETKQEIIIKNTDFAIQVNNIPIEATYISNSLYNEKSIKICEAPNHEQTFEVWFYITATEQTNYKLLYKGKELLLGVKTKI